MTRPFKFLIILLTISTCSFSQTTPSTKTDAEKKAMEEMDKFVEKYGESIRLEGEGDDKVKEGDFQGAIIAYSNAIKKPCVNVHELYFKRGLTKTKLTDYRGGILDYNKAIELKPKYAEAYNNRAAAKLNLKDNAGAKADANKAITLNPQIAEAYYNRGAAKINLGEINSGCLDLSKAGEMGNTMVYDIIKQYCN